jgi:hypothetical protein
MWWQVGGLRLGAGLVLTGLAVACASAEVDEGRFISAGLPGDGSAASDPTDGGTDRDDDEGSDETDTSTSDGSSTGSANTTADPDSTSDSSSSCQRSEEYCDGEDNDCDGEVDEADPDLGLSCDTRMLGVCAEGVTACEDGELRCTSIKVSEAEICDGLDNDCDGTVDNDDPDAGRACETGEQGACAAGTTACTDGRVLCLGNVGSTTEVCDGVDNDCDGDVDDGNPGGGATCGTGLPGVCSPGTLACTGGTLVCVQTTSASANDLCGDELDNDCDGAIDEDCGCAHDVCVTGPALVGGCDPAGCAAQVCAVDPFCCANTWDSVCVGLVGEACGTVCQGSCTHSPCANGQALVPGCDPAGCVSTICGIDPFCCNTSWDTLCVGRVASDCGLTC